jgi:hypothetical protein
MGKRWQTENRDAYNAAWRKWYRANAQRKMSWQQRRRDEMRLWWRALKATLCCMECGESAPECLHLHHRDPREKEIDVSAAVANACWSRERILTEIAKCDVLCANCHAKHHWDEV